MRGEARAQRGVASVPRGPVGFRCCRRVVAVVVVTRAGVRGRRRRRRRGRVEASHVDDGDPPRGVFGGERALVGCVLCVARSRDEAGRYSRHGRQRGRGRRPLRCFGRGGRQGPRRPRRRRRRRRRRERRSPRRRGRGRRRRRRRAWAHPLLPLDASLSSQRRHGSHGLTSRALRCSTSRSSAPASDSTAARRHCADHVGPSRRRADATALQQQQHSAPPATRPLGSLSGFCGMRSRTTTIVVFFRRFFVIPNGLKRVVDLARADNDQHTLKSDRLITSWPSP